MQRLELPAHQVRGTRRRSGHVTWDSFAKVEVAFARNVKQLQEITVLQNPTLPLAKRVLQGATAWGIWFRQQYVSSRSQAKTRVREKARQRHPSLVWLAHSNRRMHLGAHLRISSKCPWIDTMSLP